MTQSPVQEINDRSSQRNNDNKKGENDDKNNNDEKNDKNDEKNGKNTSDDSNGSVSTNVPESESEERDTRFSRKVMTLGPKGRAKLLSRVQLSLAYAAVWGIGGEFIIEI